MKAVVAVGLTICSAAYAATPDLVGYSDCSIRAAQAVHDAPQDPSSAARIVATRCAKQYEAYVAALRASGYKRRVPSNFDLAFETVITDRQLKAEQKPKLQWH